MKPDNLQDLLRLARQSRPAKSEEAPQFFSQRIVACWLSAADNRERSPWEIFALRGAALSAAAVLVALALNAAVLTGSNDDTEPDYTADIFSLP